MRYYIFKKMGLRYGKTGSIVFVWVCFFIIYQVFTTRSQVYIINTSRYTVLTKYNHEGSTPLLDVKDNETTAHDTIRIITDARKSPKCLFEKLKILNTSFLPQCDMKEKFVIFDDGLKDLDHVQDNNNAYKVYVPRWQDNLAKLTQPDTKHFLSAVIRLRLYKEDKAKWTLAEFKQWIHYQFLAGTEHIYLCNHFLDESEILEEPLKRYIDSGLLTYIAWNHTVSIPGMSDYMGHNHLNQLGCYNYVLKTFGNQTTWLYSFDMDEYPFVVHDQCEGFFSRYLQGIEKTNDNISAVYLDNFILKGQGDRSRDLTIDRINRVTLEKGNEMTKTVYKTAFTNAIGMHTVNIYQGDAFVPKSDDAKMLHYWGARTQDWGPDTEETLDSTVEFNTVRDTLAISLRSSLLSFAEYGAFSNTTGP